MSVTGMHQSTSRRLHEQNRCKPTPSILKALYSLALSVAHHSPHRYHCSDPAVPMHADATSTISLTPCHQVRFQSLGKVADQPASAYCLPSSSTRQSVDFICQPDELGWITTSFDNGIEAPQLRKAHAVLTGPKAGEQAWLTFIVPPEKFADFKQQKISGRLNPKKVNIKQRVMKMPLVSLTTRTIFAPALQCL